MKKILVIISVIIFIGCILKKDEIIIPKNSIRFRVIANSNSLEDQALKKLVVKNLKENINNIEFDSNNKDNTREIINNNIPILENTIKSTIKNRKYQINYGMNYFPKKIYKNIIYEEGEYESLVVTLGKGEGNNFWCVLFPPLCLLEEDENNKDDVIYTSVVKEIINRYL